jgi:hypothetical protein
VQHLFQNRDPISDTNEELEDIASLVSDCATNLAFFQNLERMEVVSREGLNAVGKSIAQFSVRYGN